MLVMQEICCIDWLVHLKQIFDLPPTFEGICLKILNQMVPKKNFVFSTDSYDKYSVKAQESKVWVISKA